MRLGWLPVLVVVFLILEAEALRAEENPRALIDRALQTQGGEAKLAKSQAAAMKVKGSFFIEDTQIPLTGEVFSQSSGQYKQIIHFSVGGENMTQVVVYNGKQGWIRVGDQMLDLNDDIRAELEKGRYVEQIAGLIILKKKEYQLSPAGIAQVKDKKADVVKVTSPGHPEVRLFFDKATGLLIKTEHRQLDPQGLFNQGAKTQILQETFYSDYQAADSTERDEKTLQAANMPSDGPGLLKFFQARAKVDTDREKIVTLVKQLGDKSFQVREKASQELVAVGALAVPFLKEALKSRDLEVVRRAERCLQIIQPDEAKKEQQRAILTAAVRLLAAKRPEGTTEVLLAFLPSAGADREKIVTLVKQLGDKSFQVREKASQELVALGAFAVPFLKEALKSNDLEVVRRAERCLQIIRPDDEVVEREIRAALAALAMRNGKPDPALVKALESKDALRQSAAAEALGKVPLPPGRKILADGVKRPMKAAVYRDGKLFMKWEVLEVTYFNKLEDKLFAKP